MLILGMSMRWVFFALMAVFVLAVIGVAFADIYKFVDENGVVHLTDTPQGEKTEVAHSDSAATADDADYFSLVKTTASRYSLDPSLIHAVIKTESNYNRYAVSRKGAMGLMQLMPSTAQELGVKDPFHPGENIEGGTRYLRYLLEAFNWDLTLALAAYNCGPEPVRKYGNVPPIKETREYVRKVLALYRPGSSRGMPARRKSASPQKTAPSYIYMVKREDGTVLYTNTWPTSKSTY